MMDVIHSCCCCLRRPPDKYLTTPYTHLEKTEIYADMLKQCFDIHLVVGEDGSCGICSMCVSRLRDASDFKQQVQHCQAELQEALFVEPAVKCELAGDDADGDPVSDVLYEVPIEQLETERSGEDEPRAPDEDPLIKCETPADAAADDWSPAAQLQPAGRSSAPHNPYSCEHCATWFTTTAHLQQHIQHSHSSTEHTESCIPSSPTKMLGSNEMSERAPRSYTCTECDFTTIYEKKLHSHLKSHALNNPFKCDRCDYTCQYKSYLIRHQIKHTDGKVFMCSNCSYRCNDKSNLRRHERKHTSEKPYRCSHCDYKCRERAGLQRHEMTHSGTKPFKCSTCDYSCTQKPKLRIHEMRHTGEKPFQCNHCDYKCRHKTQMQTHLRTHLVHGPAKKPV